MSKCLLPRTVFVNASGIDIESDGKRIVDTRDVVLESLHGGVTLLVGRIHSHYNRRLTANSREARRFVEAEEVCCAFPEQVPLSSHRQSHIDKIKLMRRLLEERLNLNGLAMPPQMHSVVITSSIGIQMWDEAIQLMLDYQSTDDGRISHLISDPSRNPNKGIPIHVPYFLSNPSLIGINHFIDAFKSVHELIYKRPVANIVEHDLSELINFTCKNLTYTDQRYGDKSTSKVFVDRSLVRKSDNPKITSGL